MCDCGTLQQAGFRKASMAKGSRRASERHRRRKAAGGLPEGIDGDCNRRGFFACATGLVPQGRRACDGGGPTAPVEVLMGWMADGRTSAEPEDSPDVEDPKRLRGPSPPPNSLSSCAWSTCYIKTFSRQPVDFRCEK